MSRPCVPASPSAAERITFRESPANPGWQHGRGEPPHSTPPRDVGWPAPGALPQADGDPTPGGPS